jgi:hypothetical protein
MKNCDMVSGKTSARNPIAHKLKRSVKLHEGRRQIRPPVNHRAAIAKEAARFLKENLQFKIVHSIRINLELIEKLDVLEIRNNE